MFSLFALQRYPIQLSKLKSTIYMLESINPKKIYTKSSNLGINVQHVAEVGVYLPHTSNILDWIKKGVRTTLVEPSPESIKAIEKYFKDYKNITLYKVAIFETDGKIKLYNRAASTFIAEPGSSPAMINDNYIPDESDSVEVPCQTFDKIDDGSIDVLSIDIEGAEWYVIQNMVSRPAIVSVETHGKFYLNPRMDDINNWMNSNGYRIWFKDKSDTVYIHSKHYSPSFPDSIQLYFINLRLYFRRLKRIFK